VGCGTALGKKFIKANGEEIRINVEWETLLTKEE